LNVGAWSDNGKFVCVGDGGRKRRAPMGGQGTFELGAGDFEVFEIGDYLCHLGER
jgi:hypothetical protein